MPVPHIFLAILVATIWGLNFIFIKLSLIEFHPLLLCSLRFILASVPAIFFIKPPAMLFRLVALYGIVMFALQFAFSKDTKLEAGLIGNCLQFSH